MSNAYVFAIFIATIVLLIILVAKFNWHAAPALFFCTLILALLLKTSLQEIPSLINSGFGNTCTSVAMIILLGALLGEIMSTSGGVLKITETFIKLLGKKNVLAAVGISCYIMGIPIFPDTVSLLVIPLCTNLAAQTGISMLAFAGMVGIGVTTSSLVPPTPGPVAAAALLNLPLGQAILWGILVSIPGLIATIVYCQVCLKKQVLLNQDYLHVDSANQGNLPSFWRSIFPILVPIILIVGNTVCDNMFPDTALANVTAFIGAPIMALSIGCALAVGLQIKNWIKIQDVRNGMFDKAILSCAAPIIITALGGSLAAVIKNADVANMIADMIVGAHIPGIFVPMLIACLIRSVTGSNTLGVTTAAALAEPMLGALGLTPLAAFLSMCSGAVIVSHANSSGFWLVSTMCKLEVKDSFKAVSGASTVSGVFCCATTLILYAMGII